MFSSGYTSVQRNAIHQFMSFTQTTERNAAKVLKSNSWNLEQALDSYFHSNTIPVPPVAQIDSNYLNAIFDQFKQSDGPEGSKDVLSVAGTMKYFEQLYLSLEDPTVLALCEALKSPSMGELTREGFLTGWGRSGLSCDTLDMMRAKIPELRQSMVRDETFFKRVYRWTFTWALTPGQKGLPLESAIEWWKLLLQDRFSHLDSWATFLTEKKRNSVPKDTWNMLYDFVQYTNSNPTLANYDDEGAWPSVIDDYVRYYKEKHLK